MLKKLVLLVPLLLIFSTVCVQNSAGQEIQNSEAVSYLHAEVTRSGYVYLFDNSPFQTARELTVTLTIPQNSTRQTSYIKSVTGPDRYYMGEDAWGNKVVNLYWEIPDLKKRLYYTIVSDVEVSDGTEAAGNAKFPVTDFTKATTGIAQVTFDVTYGLDDIQRYFRLTEWVHKNVKYDNEAKGFSQSAIWTFVNRKGACDEFSNLLISMLRVLGYEPRYVVGYAYSENWGQHGWVEVDYNGRTVSLDPTWMESPVDSTHIKIAELADSNLTEHVEVKGGQITIDWNKEEPEIKVISHEESPKISIGATLIPENSSSDSYSLLSTEFASPECILTNVQVKSCTIQSEENFLSIPKSSESLAFCGLQKAYWFLKAPAVEGGMVYTCPVIIYGGGAEKSVTVTVGPGPTKRLRTSVKSQNVFTPGEVFEVESLTENSGYGTEKATVYVFFGGSIQSKDFTLKPGDSASIKWTLKAPATPGSQELVVFSSSGEMVSRNITVIQQRHIQIQNISAPDKASAKKELTINITVKAITGFSGTANITIGEYSDTKGIFLGPSESKTFQVAYTPQSPGAKIISVAVFSDSKQYEDGWWGTLDVQNEKQWWDSLLEWLQRVVDSIIRAFTGG